MKQIILTVLVLSALAVGLIYSLLHTKEKQEQTTQKLSERISPTVEAMIAKPSTWQDTLTLPATLQPWERSTVSAALDGRLEGLTVEEGASVAKGQVLATLYAPMRIADLAQAQIALKKAAYELNRQQALAAAENTTKADLQTATLAHEAATITLANLEKQQAESRIVAPVAGVLTAKRVQNGVYVQPGTELLQLSVVDKLKIEAFVSAGQLSSITIGQHWTARLAHNGRTFSVAVASLNPEPSAARTYKITWSANPAPKGWLPGMSVTLQSQQHLTANVWQLPTTALSGTERAFVLTQLHKGIAHKIPAQVVGRNAQSVWCKAPLSGGDTLLISGQHLLAEGAKPGRLVWVR